MRLPRAARRPAQGWVCRSRRNAGAHGRCGIACRDDARAAKRTGPGRRGDRRMSPVDRSQQRVIGARGLLVRELRLRGRQTLRSCESLLLRRLGHSPTIAAIIADVVDGCIVHHRAVVDIGDLRVADIVDRTVVIERAVIPVASLVADATIAEAVVDAPVKSDTGSPVALIEHVDAIVPTPIARSPEQAYRGRLYPGARYPEIPVRSIRPIARRPDIARRRYRWLHINGKERRRDRDVKPDPHLCEGRGRPQHETQR